MTSTLVAVATVVALALWHMRTRRHANWQSCADGRYFITLGYPIVGIALYWLTEATRGVDWAWALGNLWAFAAMVSFVRGFNALNAPTRIQRATPPLAPPESRRPSRRTAARHGPRA